MIQLHNISTRVDASVDQLRNWSHAIDATGYRHERLVIPGKHDRLLSKPADWLRPVLDKLATWFYEALPVHTAAHGYVIGRSILTHAQQHVHAPAGPAWLVTLDLRDWFGTIKETRIAIALERARWAPDAAALAAKLCCERGHLPQGAPTSPVLANFCAYAFDHRLTQTAAARGFAYSRFADDLAFSTAVPVVFADIKKLLTHIHGHAERASFVVHPKKTQITRPWQQQDVTGLIVNGGIVRPARVMMRQLRAAIHNLAQGKDGEWTVEQIRGSIGFVQMVDKERGAKLLAAFEQAKK